MPSTEHESGSNPTGHLRVVRRRGSSDRPTTANMPLWAIARDASATQMATFVFLCLWIAFLMFVVRRSPPPSSPHQAEGPSTEKREPEHILKS